MMQPGPGVGHRIAVVSPCRNEERTIRCMEAQTLPPVRCLAGNRPLGVMERGRPGLQPPGKIGGQRIHRVVQWDGEVGVPLTALVYESRGRPADGGLPGGINPSRNPGVYRFKKRMSGAEVKAAGPFERAPGGFRARVVRGAEKLYGDLANRSKTHRRVKSFARDHRR